MIPNGHFIHWGACPFCFKILQIPGFFSRFPLMKAFRATSFRAYASAGRTGRAAPNAYRPASAYKMPHCTKQSQSRSFVDEDVRPSAHCCLFSRFLERCRCTRLRSRRPCWWYPLQWIPALLGPILQPAARPYHPQDTRQWYCPFLQSHFRI